MLSNKAAIAAVGVVALVGAAGAGAFLASRQADPGGATPVASLAPANGSGVEATEAVVDDSATSEPSPVAPVPAPATASASVPSPAKAPVEAARRAEPAKAPTASSSARDRNRAATARQEPSRQRPQPAESSDTISSRPAAQPDRPVESVEPATARDDRRAIDPVPALPPARQFEEVTVPADAVIGLQLESGLSSDTARIEDRVEARVTRDVRASGQVAIPAGSRVLGSVSLVERGGKMKERARLGVRFHTVILADGTELPLQTETVYREGESPANASAAKVGGGAIGGAILGAILGGGKGAAIGGAVGAGAGTAAVMAGGRKAAQIQAGAPLTVKVLSPVTVTVEK